MKNKVKQFKNALIYLLPTVIGNLFPLITLPIFTRILTKEDYGVLALAQIFAIIANGLANFGMMTGYDRNFFQYKNHQRKAAKLLYSTLLFVLINFIIIAVFTYLFRGDISKFVIGSKLHGKIIFVSFCAQFFITIIQYYLTFFKNSEAAKDFSFYTISVTLLNLLASLFFVVFMRTGVIGLVYAQLFAGITIFCVLSFKFIKMLRPSVDRSIFFESLRISYPLTPRIFLGVISTQFDKYMIGLMANVGGVGIYGIGQKISNAIFIYMTSIQNVFSPQVYQQMFDMKENAGVTIGKYLTPFVYICIFAATLVSTFSEEIVSILTPPTYHQATDIVIVLSIYYGLLFFGKINGNQLVFMKKTHITSFLTMINIFLNVGFNVPFIMKWGAIGAAWGTCLAGSVSGFISFIISQRYYRIEWEYKKIGAVFFIFIGSAILMILLRQTSSPYEAKLMLKFVTLLAYILLGIKLNVISLENFLLVKKSFSRKNVI